MIELKALRYTPAGVPAVDLRLQHQSVQMQAGSERQVQFEIKAVALGAVAEQIARLPLTSRWSFKGFLAAPRNGKNALFHIQELRPLAANE